MLVYHPAFDLYNCAFRILLILHHIKSQEVSLEKILIWDYYVTFPYKVKEIKFTRNTQFIRKIFSRLETNPYEFVSDDKIVFSRMRNFQVSALRSLASYDLIDAEALRKGIVKRTNNPIPEAIVSQFENISLSIKNVISLVESPFNELPLYGNKGFKDRTKLIDFRYDSM